MAEVIKRSTFEFYASLILAILMLLVPMTWLWKLILLLIMVLMIIDVILRLPWIINLRKRYKIVIFIGIIILSIPILWYIVHDQWVKDNPMIQTEQKPIEKPSTLPEKKDAQIIKPTEKKEAKKIEPSIKPKLKITVSSPVTVEDKFQGYRLWINNDNRKSVSVTDFTMEFRFKGIIVGIEQWPGLMTGDVGMGRFEFQGKRQDGSEFTQVIRPPMPKNCSFNIPKDIVDKQRVNSNVLVFNCDRWPRNIGFFSAKVLVDPLKKPEGATKGPEGTYIGTYYYEVEGRVLSGTLSGSIKDAYDKKN